MGTYIALRDRRLEGGVPARAGLRIINTHGSTPLGSAFASINSASRVAGRIQAMFILCHGYAGSNERARVCIDAGGMGLQLGKEDVLHENVSMWTAIKNRVKHIIVYSCAASNTEGGNEGTNADGRYLMGQWPSIPTRMSMPPTGSSGTGPTVERLPAASNSASGRASC